MEKGKNGTNAKENRLAAESALYAEGLEKRFRMGNGEEFYALRDIHVEVPQGSLVILRGRSGSGKTTLLNLLSGLDEPTSGHIRFFGEELTKQKKYHIEEIRRHRMGFVFQSIALVPVMTAYENIEFGLRLAAPQMNPQERYERICSVMERVGLRKRMEHMAGQLSGGEQQRVAIARALAHHPRVIFADEPTGALDTATGLAVVQLFREVVAEEQTTIVMSTHDPNLCKLSDVVYEMQDGRILS